MIKFKAQKNNKPIIGLGISKINIERLMSGEPILVKGSDLDISELGEIIIFYGETEKKMYEDLKKGGFDLGSQTIDLNSMRSE